jgi:hypothetical protein
MTLNCKPGDLAYVVRSVIPENIGIVVEVLRACTEYDCYANDPAWWVRSPSPTMHTDGSFQRDGTAYDRNLRPISGVPVDEEVTDEVSA